MTCPIFTAARAASRVFSETGKLSVALTDILGQSYPVQDGDSHWVEGENDWVSDVYAFELLITGIVPRQRRHSQVVFSFDLFRDVDGASLWPHAREAVMVVAYSPLQANGWDVDSLKIDALGTVPEYAGKLVPETNGRILRWKEDRSDLPWSRREWIFGVAMKDLTDLASVKRLATDPLLALISDSPPDVAFAGAKPVTWPTTMP